MTKETILIVSKQTFAALTAACEQLDEKSFFERPGEKWSAAEHLQHLVIATNTSKLAFSLPLFIVKLVGGTPNRPSRSYDELVEKYRQKLAAGGRASGRFIPQKIKAGTGKQALIRRWENTTAVYLEKLEQKRPEPSLDQYLVKHPLLGRITLRELCYFNIYHTLHHQKIIETATVNAAI
ncbi:MAG: DinB family protein [Ferruginibacter sp.]